MGRSVTGKNIDRVLAGGVARWFRAAGFTRRGHGFSCERGDVILTGSLQASKTNMPGDARFALNLGVVRRRAPITITGGLPIRKPSKG